jgi:hypothetical protein
MSTLLDIHMLELVTAVRHVTSALTLQHNIDPDRAIDRRILLCGV